MAEHSSSELAALAQQKFRMVFDAAGIGIAIGTGGMLTETNAAYQGLLGYTAEELSRMHYSEITHPDDRDLDNEDIAELASGQKPPSVSRNAFCTGTAPRSGYASPSRRRPTAASASGSSKTSQARTSRSRRGGPRRAASP